MLKDLISLFTGFALERAPKKFPRPMSPLHTRQSQTASHDVDFVQGAIASAQGGDITQLLSLYRDVETSHDVIQGAINIRKLAVLARGFSVIPAKNSGAAGEQVAEETNAMLERSQSFIDACGWLLHGFIWPCSIVNIRWVPGGPHGGFSHPEFRDVPLELFDYTEKTLRIKDVGAGGEPLATAHTPDESRYIVHRGHLIKAPDNWGGPMRALIFWNLFSQQDREWWARFLERFGSPFLVGRYDKGDDESRLNLVNAFSEATRLFGIVATNETQVELKESIASSNSSQAFKDFHEVATNAINRLILGQTLSGSAQPTGLGSGTANLHGAVREDLRLWDAFKLSSTIKSSVIVPWMKMNGIKGPAPTLTWGGFDAAVLEGIGKFLQALSAASYDIDDDSLTTLSRYMGLTLERRATPTPVGQPDAMMSLLAALPPSTQANEAIARDAAANLSRALSGDLAPLAEIVKSSRTKEELLRRSSAFLSRFRPTRSPDLLAAALTSHAANALAR